jgi:hypothetical protein
LRTCGELRPTTTFLSASMNRERPVNNRAEKPAKKPFVTGRPIRFRVCGIPPLLDRIARCSAL